MSRRLSQPLLPALFAGVWLAGCSLSFEAPQFAPADAAADAGCGVLFRDDFESGAFGPAWSSDDALPWTVVGTGGAHSRHSAIAGSAASPAVSALSLRLAGVPHGATLSFDLLPDLEFAELRFVLNGEYVTAFDSSNLPRDVWVPYSVPAPEGELELRLSFEPESTVYGRPRIDNVAVVSGCAE